MTLSPILFDRLEPNGWLAKVYQNAVCYHSLPDKLPYVGRFAPSPSGLLHQGSLIAALASYLHARWHGGLWLIRLEDVDRSRCLRAYGDAQIQTLRELGFRFSTPVWQSERYPIYQAQFERLMQKGLVYPCSCTRKMIGDGVYQGTCRKGCAEGLPIRSWRYRVSEFVIDWADENQMCFHESLNETVGDFVLKRVVEKAHHEWTYQFAVVVDDAAQGITHVVRGADLLDSTGRQIALQHSLGYPTPVYNHFPLLVNASGEKLSKSGQAPALDALNGLAALSHAWAFLGGKPLSIKSTEAFWRQVLPE